MTDRVAAVHVLTPQTALLVGLDRGRVAMLTPAGKAAELRKPDGAAVRFVSGAADGALLTVGMRDGRVELRSADQLLAHMRLDGPVVGILPLEAGRRILVLLGTRRALSWTVDPDGEQSVEELVGEGGKPVRIDGIAGPLASGEVVLRTDFAWHLWDPRSKSTGRLVEPVDPRGLLYETGCLGMSGSGSFFYIYWDDYQLFDTVSGDELLLAPTRFKPLCAALSDDGESLLLGDKTGRLIAVQRDGNARYELKIGESRVRDGRRCSGRSRCKRPVGEGLRPEADVLTSIQGAFMVSS